MKKTEMLKKNYEFRQALSRGRFYTNKEIEIVVLKNNKKINLLGIAIGTKIGKAFQRNKAKRLIRECYKILETDLKEGNTIIILLKKECDIRNLKFKDVLISMKACFDKAKFIKEEE